MTTNTEKDYPMNGMGVTFQTAQDLIETLESLSGECKAKNFAIKKAPAAIKTLAQMHRTLMSELDFWGQKAFERFKDAKDEEEKFLEDQKGFKGMFSAAELKTKDVKSEVEAFDAEYFNRISDMRELENECRLKASRGLDAANYLETYITRVAEDIDHSPKFYLRERAEEKLDQSNLLALAKDLGIKGKAFLEWKKETVANHEAKVAYLNDIEAVPGTEPETWYKAILFSRRSAEFSIEQMETIKIKDASNNAVKFKQDKAGTYDIFFKKAEMVQQAVFKVLDDAYEVKIDDTQGVH